MTLSQRRCNSLYAVLIGWESVFPCAVWFGPPCSPVWARPADMDSRLWHIIDWWAVVYCHQRSHCHPLTPLRPPHSPSPRWRKARMNSQENSSASSNTVGDTVVEPTVDWPRYADKVPGRNSPVLVGHNRCSTLMSSHSIRSSVECQRCISHSLKFFPSMPS